MQLADACRDGGCLVMNCGQLLAQGAERAVLGGVAGEAVDKGVRERPLCSLFLLTQFASRAVLP